MINNLFNFDSERFFTVSSFCNYRFDINFNILLDILTYQRNFEFWLEIFINYSNCSWCIFWNRTLKFYVITCTLCNFYTLMFFYYFLTYVSNFWFCIAFLLSCLFKIYFLYQYDNHFKWFTSVYWYINNRSQLTLANFSNFNSCVDIFLLMFSLANIFFIVFVISKSAISKYFANFFLNFNN